VLASTVHDKPAPDLTGCGLENVIRRIALDRHHLMTSLDRGVALPHQCGDGVTVDVAYLAGAGRFTRGNHLIACGQDGHTR